MSVKKLTGQQFAEIFAALQAAEKAQSGASAKRHSRLDIEGGNVQIVDVASKTGYTALTRDISYDGLTLLQARAPDYGAVVIVALARRKGGHYHLRCSVMDVRELAESVYSVRCGFISVVETAPVPAAAASAPVAGASAAPATAAAATAAAATVVAPGSGAATPAAA